MLSLAAEVCDGNFFWREDVKELSASLVTLLDDFPIRYFPNKILRRPIEHAIGVRELVLREDGIDGDRPDLLRRRWKMIWRSTANFR